MRSVALVPGLALVVGAAAGGFWPDAVPTAWSMVGVLGVAWWGWWAGEDRIAVPLIGVAYALAGGILGGAAETAAQGTSLRAVLDTRYGGFAPENVAAAGTHPPLRTRLRLTEDAAESEGGVRLRGQVEDLWIDGVPSAVEGGVLVAVAGESASDLFHAWRAGRLIEAPITFRRPARYLTRGVDDAEAASARQGIALLGRVKSGLSVEVIGRGSARKEWAADVRAIVRTRVAAHMPRTVRRRSASGAAGVDAGIVTALLIGDRTAIPAEVRNQLQAAGTYHVIAISGGNIAVLVLVATLVLRVAGARPRLAAVVAIPALVTYAGIVSGGPSVHRAVIMAVVYLAARALDLRAPVWNTLAVSAGLLVCLDPLDVRDAGFWLTFGATVALVGAGRLAGREDRSATVAAEDGARVLAGIRRAGRWLLASVHASMLVELVILPVTVVVFSRVTLAGIAANLIAVPAMTVAQIAGMLIALGLPAPLADLCGAVAARSTGALLMSSAVTDWASWLSPRVPAPPLGVWSLYAVLLAVAWRSRRPRLVAAALCVAVGTWANWPRGNPPGDGQLTMTMLDVGQGESMLLRLPDGRAILVDAGGGGGGMQIGERVIGPALWARGIHRLDGVLITHADPDHSGAADAIVRDFKPKVLWTGIRVPSHAPTRALELRARRAGTRQARLADGDRLELGEVSLHVLHPEWPDWERPAVRNDDSVVVEVRYGSVAVLLTGDAGMAVERMLMDRLRPARVRILKVGHHGSRTSTGADLVAGWPPHLALISCGRGNPFGHPVAAVLERLGASGATVLRTDRDGEVAFTTDGRSVTVETYRSPGRRALYLRN